jgi:hypothetical protein
MKTYMTINKNSLVMKKDKLIETENKLPTDIYFKVIRYDH